MKNCSMAVRCTRDVKGDDLRLYFLNAIGFNFVMLLQEYNHIKHIHADRPGFLQYTAKIEALLEAIEVLDCGSVGGFDGLQSKYGRATIFERWCHVYNKEHDVTKFKYHSVTYKDLFKVFGD